MANLAYTPMRRYVVVPLNNGGFETDIRIESASDSAVNDGLPLLFEQSDEPLLAINVTVDALINVIEIVDDGYLLGKRRNGQECRFDRVM